MSLLTTIAVGTDPNIHTLRATRRTQGWRKNDECTTILGSMVWPKMDLCPFCHPMRPDDGCCARMFTDAQGQCTTTAVVMVQPRQVAWDYVTRHFLANTSERYHPQVREGLQQKAFESDFIGRVYAPGTVLEFRYGRVMNRPHRRSKFKP